MICIFGFLINLVVGAPCIEKILSGSNKGNQNKGFDYVCYEFNEQYLKNDWEQTRQLFLKCPDPLQIYRNDTSTSETERIHRAATECARVGDSIDRVQKRLDDSVFLMQEAIIKRDVGKYKGEFPGDILLSDSKVSLKEFIAGCYDLESEIGTESCDFILDSTMNIKIGTFESSEFKANFYFDKNSKLKLPYQVVITSGLIDECRDAVDAKSAIEAVILAKYGKGHGVSISKGAKFGSKKCKDYMDESLSNLTLKNGPWQYVVDSYWYDGGYYVYIKYQFLPRLQEVRKTRSEKNVSELIDGMEKL